MVFRRIRNLIISIILIFTGCSEDIGIDNKNPLDPNNPDYDSPIVTFIAGIVEGDTITTSDATFEWEGNLLVTEYRIRFNDNEWGEWNNQTSAFLQFLDEGNYSLSVQGRYSTGDTSSIITYDFVVNAVDGPALMFYPRVIYSTVGSNVTFQILAEEVNSLTAAQFNISFDTTKLEIVSVTQGSMLQINGESIFSVDYDNQTGTISVITAALGGDQPSADGTGVLLDLVLEVKASGTSNLIFDGSELLRGPNNHDIVINETVAGVVVAE